MCFIVIEVEDNWFINFLVVFVYRLFMKIKEYI